MRKLANHRTAVDSRHHGFSPFGTPARLVAAGVILMICANPGPTPAAVNHEQDMYMEKLHELKLLTPFGIAPADSVGLNATLADYLGYAAVHNEELRAAILAWQAIKDRVPQATALPDPRFLITEYLESVETRVGPQERAFGLSQTIPWFGKLSLKGQIEEERATAAAARVKAVFLRIAYRVKSSYYDLAYLKHSLAITEEHLELLSQWEEVARSRYATGVGSYADVIKAQVELGKLSDRIEELRDRYRPLAAALNAALNRPSSAPIAWPTELATQGSPIDEGALLLRFSVENPEIVSLEHQAMSFLRAEKLAGKQKYPDLTLGINYIQTGDARLEDVPGSGKDPILASLSVNIPIWRGKYNAAEREAASSYLAAHSTRREKENILAASLERALFGYRDALRKMDLYGDTLLPKGRQSLGATMAAYETGKAGFLDLVDAERLLLEFQLSHARAAADLMIQLAEIEMLVGGPVTTGVEN